MESRLYGPRLHQSFPVHLTARRIQTAAASSASFDSAPAVASMNRPNRCQIADIHRCGYPAPAGPFQPFNSLEQVVSKIQTLQNDVWQLVRPDA